MVFAQMSSLTSGNARKRPSSSLPSSAAAAASADRGRVKRAKAAVARGADRAPAQWCKTCVRRLRNDPRHSCSNQAGTGARCVDCSSQNHSCEPIPRSVIPAVTAAHAAAAALRETPDNAALKAVFEQAADEALRQLRLSGAAGRRNTSAPPAVGGAGGAGAGAGGGSPGDAAAHATGAAGGGVLFDAAAAEELLGLLRRSAAALEGLRDVGARIADALEHREPGGIGDVIAARIAHVLEQQQQQQQNGEGEGAEQQEGEDDDEDYDEEDEED